MLTRGGGVGTVKVSAADAPTCVQEYYPMLPYQSLLEMLSEGQRRALAAVRVALTEVPAHAQVPVHVHAAAPHAGGEKPHANVEPFVHQNSR